MKDKIYAIVFMFVTSSVFVAALSVANMATRDIRSKNQLVKKYRAILKMCDLADDNTDTDTIIDIYKASVKPRKHGDIELYHIYDKAKNKIAIVHELNGQGFWGPIMGYVALEPSGEKIIGVSITKHDETPGLGQRIEEEWFLVQFEDVNINKEVEGKIINFLKSGEAEKPGYMKAITGATRTSDSMEKILNDSLKEFREAFKKDPEGSEVNNAS